MPRRITASARAHVGHGGHETRFEGLVEANRVRAIAHVVHADDGVRLAGIAGLPEQPALLPRVERGPDHAPVYAMPSCRIVNLVRLTGIDDPIGGIKPGDRPVRAGGLRSGRAGRLEVQAVDTLTQWRT